MLQAARDSAGQTIGLVDSTKFGRASMVSIARAQDLDLIITDDALPATVATEFRRKGVRLHVAATSGDVRWHRVAVGDEIGERRVVDIDLLQR